MLLYAPKRGSHSTPRSNAWAAGMEVFTFQLAVNSHVRD
jgi:hypothetical protein